MENKDMRTKPSWGVVIAKGLAAGIILIVWCILFSNYAFIWEANWSFWGLTGSWLAAVVLAVTILCHETTRYWGWSYLISVCTLVLFIVIMGFIPNSASLLWGSYEFWAGTRFISRMILYMLPFGYVLTPVIMLYIRLLERDRRKNASQDAKLPASRSLRAWKTAVITLILTAVPLIRFSKTTILCTMLDRCGVWSAPILLLVFSALALPVLFFRGSRSWQRCLLGAEAVSAVIWIVWSIVGADADLSFVLFLNRAEILVGHVLLISLCMFILRWIIRRKALDHSTQES